ncbi:PTS system mannose/fructose/sorbose family transporter subunit IID [Tetragenococcus solitarius]|uniref:PTS system mannose/fructose/sorbose family transporter subunit IID n=1 Tax=Tetragenococcus solitarius TaxID=71453 RepID=A0ABN3Y3D4_9ENTE|nr:PTS system mannose/fructose/sorbose family transporter subunit IID [Tetragenococcus solitarius]
MAEEKLNNEEIKKEEDNNNIVLSKKDIVKSFWRWRFFVQSNYNYERLQSTGVIFSLSPVLKKLYGPKTDEMSEALKRHIQFFNTEAAFGGTILGMTIAMEEEKANGAPINTDTINGLKTGMMGPLAGIGDTLWQGTLIPILLSFTLPFASQGNIVLGPILFAVLHMGLMLVLSYNVWMFGYRRGREGVQELLSGSALPKVMSFAQTLGAIVIGGLAAQFVDVVSPATLNLSSDVTLSIQEDVLDELVVGILPLGITLLTYYLLKKQFKPTTVLVILIILGAVLAGFGLIGTAD